MTAGSKYDVSNNTDDSHSEKDGSAKTVAYQDMMCGFYGLILFVLGLVFPISTALAASGPDEQDYILTLHLIMNLLGIIFIIYLLVLFITNNTCGKKDTEEAADTTWFSIYWHPEGVSLYVRLGAIFFGLATVLQGVFRMISECRGTLFEAQYALNIIFVVLQTVTLVKYHKACISVFTFFTRWGFAHLIAVNLSQWAWIVTAEITETLIHKMHSAGGHGDHGDHGDYHGDAHPGDGHGDYLDNSTAVHDDTHDIHKRAAAAVKPGACDFTGSLQYQTAPYLFPCIVEYSLVMAAICYKLYGNVSKQPKAGHQAEVEAAKWKFSICYIISGFIGCLAIIAAVASVVLIYEQKGEEISITFFYYLQFALLVIAFFALIPAIMRFLKMGWHLLEDPVDGQLLVVAFFLSLVLDVFLIIGDIGNYESDSEIALVSIIRLAFSILQSVLQVMFILGGLARRAKTKEQAEQKPGRSFVLFLLLVNIGLWIMAVFEIKIQKNTDLHEDYYGIYGWTITKSVCTPLVIFFRFHSTVCLADIFTEAYHYHPHSH